jgi:hypothetical protein
MKEVEFPAETGIYLSVTKPKPALGAIQSPSDSCFLHGKVAGM